MKWYMRYRWWTFFGLLICAHAILGVLVIFNAIVVEWLKHTMTGISIFCYVASITAIFFAFSVEIELRKQKRRL